MESYDIAIIGAGPAGATLARLVGQKYKVLLIDKRKMDTPYQPGDVHKCCGGLLAPDAQKILARLGLGVPQHTLVGQQLFMVRTIDLQNSQERFYQRHYLNLDRENFDRWLISLIPEQVERCFGYYFKSLEPTKQGYLLNFAKQAEEFSAQAKVIIGADGAASRLRKCYFPNRPFPKTYISIQEWFDVPEDLPYLSAIFDEEITDFYAWTISKDNYLIIGAALEPGKQATSKFELLKTKLKNYGFKFGTPIKKEGAMLMRPQSTKEICLGQEGIALIGEAAGWISPSSAEGISYAFNSAYLLAQSLNHNLEMFLSGYYRVTASMRRNIILKNLKSPFMYNPWLRKLVMNSGVESLKVSRPELLK
jgi:flavin-dependent dehydrogenase